MAIDPDGARYAAASASTIAAVRSFVAVLLPDELRRRLSLEVDALRRCTAGIAWVAAENLHITLKFLGDVDEPRLAEVAAAVEQAATVNAFDVAMRGLGAFPTPTRPRVIWAGTAPAPAFVALGQAVDRAVAALGVAPETRPFAPHVTLGRVREPRRDLALAAALEAAAARAFGTLTVGRVSLMRSDLSPRGARYTELRGWTLPPAGDPEPSDVVDIDAPDGDS